ncbi:MAG: hypothetical protein Q7T82_08790 [Armatimonadota bacterium]|nr:hypothetical protein [Armatimonadota bacterium]
MKATIIVSIALCLVVGGIAGWALRGLTAHPSSEVAMADITPLDVSGGSRLAIYDSGVLSVVWCDRDGGKISEPQTRKIK